MCLLNESRFITANLAIISFYCCRRILNFNQCIGNLLWYKILLHAGESERQQYETNVAEFVKGIGLNRLG